jgi:hypothetical protein
MEDRNPLSSILDPQTVFMCLAAFSPVKMPVTTACINPPV